MDLHEQQLAQRAWEGLNAAQKKHALYLKQKRTLDLFLERGAISRLQHDKSLHDLSERMGEAG